mgnify:CR=1 FL=1|jgi:uncharacterized membrane protein
MRFLSCETMREGVIVSASFLVTGVILLFLISSGIIPSAFYLPLIFNVLGIFCLLFAPLILIGTFITTVLPKSRKKLENCDR